MPTTAKKREQIDDARNVLETVLELIEIDRRVR